MNMSSFEPSLPVEAWILLCELDRLFVTHVAGLKLFRLKAEGDRRVRLPQSGWVRVESRTKHGFKMGHISAFS